MGKFIHCVIYGLVIFAASHAQPTIVTSNWAESGMPYIQNFSPKEYKESPQNWSIVQDRKGIMYFANTHGILEYDGVSWRLIKTSNGFIVRSLALVNDTIYAGGSGDLGYLAPDEKGQMQFVSLLSHVPEESRDFKDVWYTLPAPDGIYFMASHHLFRWGQGTLQQWKSPGGYHTAFVVNDRLYVRIPDAGLFQMVDDSLQLALQGERFAQERVCAMLPYDNNNILIATRTQGLMLYNGSALTHLAAQLAPFFQENQLYHGVNLPFGLFAFATLHGGVVITDKQGHPYQWLNKTSGLRDESVYCTFVDREGALWLALDNGIARVETPAPLSRYAVETTVESIIRHQGILYAATHWGVYYLEPSRLTSNHVDEATFARFRQVEDIATYAWSLLVVNDQLLVATDRGIYKIRGKEAVQIENTTDYNALSLYRSREDTSLVFVGLLDGLAALRLDKGIWEDLGKIEGISEEVIRMAEDAEGNLWAGTQYQGLIKVSNPASSLRNGKGPSQQEITKYGKAHGLPPLPISPANIGGKMLFATNKGLRSFDEDQQQFVPDTTFGQQFADTTCWIFRIEEDFEQNVWLIAGVEKQPINGKAVLQADGSYQWYDTPFLRLTDMGNMAAIYPEKDGTVWLGGSEGIARFTPDFPKKYDTDYAAMIRKVSIIGSDSVFFFGASTMPPSFHPVIPYEENSLRFEFAALSFDDVVSNQYQVMLEGFDKHWSQWTVENRKDYTGLPEGDYIFRVRAKNVVAHPSSESQFAFTVLPPWYRTWWAYLMYLLLGGAVVFAFVKWRVRQLEQKSKALEETVASRTTQVVEQRNQLQVQSEQLKEMDKLKSHFFANISHEFRTPLTLILGMLDQYLSNAKDQKEKESYQVMHRNASRLLQLINQLLDLSKLEAGGAQLVVKKGDIMRFLRRIVMSFASLAEQRGIQLTFNKAPIGSADGHMAVPAYFDEDTLEKVFYNLLSNAIKFTPEGGYIDISTSMEIQDLNTHQTLSVAVCNSGPGIPADKLPYIFNRFYQVEGSSVRKFEGTGIGLSLVKELIALHHGEVHVTSIVDQETIFTVTLPLSRAAFTEDEIAEGAVVATEDAPIAEAIVPELSPSSTNIPKPQISENTNEATLILIVEDHLELREFIKEQLKEDYTVIEAENGAIGLEQAIENIPDLVISDVMMPEMDGYTLCTKLKTNEKTNHIPVILLTAKAATENKLEGLETGADDYLIKPFNPQELKVRVRNLIRLRQQMREKFSSEMLLKPTEITVASTQKVFLEKVIAVVEEHLDDEQFSVEQLGEEIGMSRAQTHRKLRALTNQSPSEFIRSFRLQRAAALIRQQAGNIAEISYQVGFSSQAYFSRCFQEEFGQSPSEYRKKILSGQA